MKRTPTAQSSDKPAEEPPRTHRIRDPRSEIPAAHHGALESGPSPETHPRTSEAPKAG